MGKNLIIVESPAKVKTIKKFLGNQYMVHASVGHIRDLPKKEIGVDEQNNFAPHYEIIQGKEKIVNELKAAASKADTVYLAPDPDREGEAIAWHIAHIIQEQNQNIKRIKFNEITGTAVKKALENPEAINPDLFDAQQARRILDRLVGYKISPLLWKTVKKGISAGRVQSVALKLIVEREEERAAFVPEEFWTFKAVLEGSLPPQFKAELAKLQPEFEKQLGEFKENNKKSNKKILIPNQTCADLLEKAMEGKPFIVTEIEEKERARNPLPPFTTSTLQQAANQRLNFPSKRTMSIAQKLYEGVDLGELGTTALITYMRTDSVRIAAEAKAAAVKFINKNYGENYAAPGGSGRSFKGKATAQDAHEAIRPVNIELTPEMVKSHLTPEQFRLYDLIWRQFIASQMAPAKFHDTNITLNCGPSLWKAKGERMLFPGFLAIMPKGNEEEGNILPELKKDEEVKLIKLEKEQKFTQPPARFTEASLVRELEALGIGRPSTYATIISTIQERDYVHIEEKHFIPTQLGTIVCTQLREHFPHLMDVGFTAEMEEDLDKVADGKLVWTDLMKNFASDFNPTLAEAAKVMKSVKNSFVTDVPCPQCGAKLAVRFGKTGEFLACQTYPKCNYTANFTRDENGNIQIQENKPQELESVGVCPQCQGNLVVKKSRLGARFISCSNYPKCNYAIPFSTKVVCPKCGTGTIVEKASKRGKLFYGCDQFPKCDYALWDMPIPKQCPQCGSPFLLLKNNRAGKYIYCPEKTCNYKAQLPEAEKKS